MDNDCSYSNYDFLSLLKLNSCEEFDYVNFYNSLPTVEDADSALQERSNFLQFLEDASHLAHLFLGDIASIMGLRLLHKHFDLSHGQVA